MHPMPRIHAILPNSRFRNCLVVMCVAAISLALLPTPAQSQNLNKPTPLKTTKTINASKKEVNDKAIIQPDFEEAAEYITNINRISEPRPRGEFETMESYDARQPKLSGAAVLLRLERGYKNYSYDIDRKLLSIHIPLAKIRPKKSLSGLPIQAAYKVDKQGEYIASNAYGAKVTVEKTYSTSYILFVPNSQLEGLVTEKENPILANMSESIRDRMRESLNEKAISLTLSAEPEDAENIAKNYVVLFRVRPKGLQYSVFEATHTSAPTIAKPKESTLFTRAIEVDISEILIRNGATGPILASKFISQ